MTAKRLVVKELLPIRFSGPEERREYVNEQVRKCLAIHKERSGSLADLSRSLIYWLRFIAAPEELIDAIARQMKVAGQPRTGPRNWAKQNKANQLLAEKPGMSNRKLAKACGVTLPTIATWRRTRKIIVPSNRSKSALAILSRAVRRAEKLGYRAFTIDGLDEKR